MANTVDFKKHHRVFKTPGVFYSVSGRNLEPEMTLVDYLKIYYMYTDLAQIESVFGHLATPCPLYGGRSFKPDRSFTERHVRQMEEHGIPLALTMTGHFFDEDAYQKSRAVLDAGYKKGHSVICTNDELARRLRKDYPDYTLKASIIKQLDTLEKIERALDLYDVAVVPMNLNDDDAFLEAIPDKDRVILFGNADCAYTCPARTCYRGFSQANAGQPVTGSCSKPRLARLDLGHVFFDVEKFSRMGFRHFKLVPLAPPRAQAVVRHFSLNHDRGTEPRLLVRSWP